MKIRMFGLALLSAAAAALIVLARHAGAAEPAEPALGELLLALAAIPCALVGLPLLMLGPALFAPAPVPLRRRFVPLDEL